MIKHALIISPTMPFPPSNGVTIPLANYIKVLKGLGWDVDLIVVDKKQKLEINEVDRILCLDKKSKKWVSFVKEIFGVSPYFCNFSISPEKELDEFLNKKYDLILASPISMVTLGTKIKDRYKQEAPVYIAAISDCTTSEFINNVSQADSLKKRCLYYIRAAYMKKLEPKVLKHADIIFVQSDADKRGLEEISKGALSSAIRIVTNGVDDTLFQNPVNEIVDIKVCGFVADLRCGYYQDKLSWLYKQVWKKSKRQGLKLKIIGRGLQKDDPRFTEMLQDPTIEYNGTFLEKVSDIYEGMDILFAPIFKTYGFINKVGEAMAAGVIVIGDQSAFNAIEGFKNGEHGIVANTEESMIQSLEALLNNIPEANTIKFKARDLAEKTLKWEAKRSVFDSLVSEGNSWIA